MKKRIVWALMLLLFLVIPAVAVKADAAVVDSGSCGEKLTWTLDENGLLTISGSGDMTDYESRFSQPWFERQNQITALFIEEGVTSIGNNAFCECSGIVGTWQIPTSVKRIGEQAFYSCEGLTGTLVIPESVTEIGYMAFRYCHGITALELKGPARIGGNAFEYCDGMTSVDLGKTVEIGARALFGNEGISGELLIPKSVTDIGDAAFAYCDGFTNVRFAGHAPTIGEDAFLHAKLVVYYPENDPTWPNARLRDYGGTLTWIAYEVEDDSIIASGTCGENLTWKLDDAGTLTISGTGDMTDYTYNSRGPWRDYEESIRKILVESQVTGIGDYAFRQCYNAIELTLPDSLTVIGDGAFMHCRSLQQVTLPKSVTEMGEWAFGHCEVLTDVTISAAIKSIPSHAFYNCVSLQNINISESVTDIGENAFENCGSIVNLTLPANLKSIGRAAFFQCTGLSAVTIPDSVTTLGQDALCYCENLASVQIGRGLDTITGRPFGGCTSLTELRVSAENDAFVSDDNVLFNADKTVLIVCPGGKTGSYAIPHSVTTIAGCAFEGCGISYVTIPDTVTDIGKGAFCRCRNLLEVVLPSGVTSIASDTFSVCEKLNSIVIPASVARMGYNPFWLCKNLKEVHFQGSAPILEYNNIFSNITATAYYPANNATWTEQARNSFGGEINWVAYEVEDDSIIASGTCGENLIWKLDDAGTLTISGTGDMTDYVGGGAPWFDYQNQITRIVLNSGITRIGDYAFNFTSRSSDVEMEIDVPYGTTSIGEDAFSGECFVKITLPESLTTIESGAFGFWCGRDGINIPESVTYIGEWAFSSCRMTSITIPEGVTVLREYTFLNCSELENVTLSSGLTRIEDGAFQNCDKLRTVEIPGKVNWMGATVFFDCENLESVTFRGDAPVIAEEYVGAIFEYDVTAYYPAGNPTWNHETLQDYNYETTTWIAYTNGDHTYGEPEFIWEETSTYRRNATAVFTCSDCGDVLHVSATVTMDFHFPAPCRKGKRIYYASVNLDGTVYNAMTEVILSDVELVPHKPEERWYTDEIYHWKKCSVCGEELVRETHTGDQNATDTTSRRCTECDQVLQIPYGLRWLIEAAEKSGSTLRETALYQRLMGLYGYQDIQYAE